MTNAQTQVMDLIFGRWRSQTLHAGVELGIFDAVGKDQTDAATVADRQGLDLALTYRLMRALASLELLAESPGRRFALTDAGALLRGDHPQTLKGVALLEEGPHHYSLWKHLPDMIRDGQQNAFVREFGRMAFEHAEVDQDPVAVPKRVAVAVGHAGHADDLTEAVDGPHLGQPAAQIADVHEALGEGQRGRGDEKADLQGDGLHEGRSSNDGSG